VQDIPVILDGITLMVSEAPTIKMITDDNGVTRPSVTKDGVTQFTVSLFAKPKPVPGEARQGRGEEVKFTLATDPGGDFPVGSYVELISPAVRYWERDGRSGLTYKALGLTPIDSPFPAPARPAGAGGSATTPSSGKAPKNTPAGPDTTPSAA
jgi:hypothetical protein